MKQLHKFPFGFRLILSIFFLTGLSLASFSQVGFDNPNPDPSALIDMKATDKGLLIPRLKTIDRTNMMSNGKRPAHALMVFDLDLNMFFVYDTIPIVDRWLAVNPWQSLGSTNADIVTATNGKVGIGTISAPSEKLEVNGNIKANGNINATGSLNSATVTTGAIQSTNINTGNIASIGTVSALKFTGDGIIPTGGIIMWSGTTTPAGWEICDGRVNNGFQTPNLSEKFIMGYGANSGAPGTTGGNNILSLSKANIPPHVHSYYDNSQSNVDLSGNNNGQSENIMTNQNAEGRNTGDGSSDGLAGQPFDNRPSFYVLAFIIKLP